MTAATAATAATTRAAVSADEWVSGNRARQIGNLTWYMLHKHVLIGEVRALAEPGSTLRYHRGDLERVGRDRTKRG